MKTHSPAARRWRAILDGLLILLLVLVLTARDEGAQAQARERAPVRYEAPASQALGSEGATGPMAAELSLEEVAPVQPEALPAPAALDNNTLAAMIAAENAALTEQQYWLDLPLVQR
jgi:hypothetical protein